MSELKSLFTASDDLDQKLLLEILVPFLVINGENKKIYFNEKGHQQTNEGKVILSLLAYKAMYVEKIIPSEEVSPVALISLFGFKRGTIHPLLKKLREKGLVTAINGKYTIPNHRLYDIKQRFKGN
jgi:hypothetical protein